MEGYWGFASCQDSPKLVLNKPWTALILATHQEVTRTPNMEF